MKLKELQSMLQDVRPFANPRVDLEQYPTGAELASRMLYTIEASFNDFAGRRVIDLGCGTAMLSIGAALLGASHVLGLDIDPEALEVAQENCEEFEDLPVDFCLIDVTQLLASLKGDEEGDDDSEEDEDAGPSTSGRQAPPHRLLADTVVMNPPFGTKRKGVDMEFLRAAFRLSTGAVYSLHKSSTRAHIQKIAERELGAKSAEVLAQLRYDLPATMKFHKQKSVDIEVDLWRFEVPDPAPDVRILGA